MRQTVCVVSMAARWATPTPPSHPSQPDEEAEPPPAAGPRAVLLDHAQGAPSARPPAPSRGRTNDRGRGGDPGGARHLCRPEEHQVFNLRKQGREREIEGEAEAEARGRRTSRCCGARALVNYAAPSLSRRQGPLALRMSLADFMVLLRLVPDLTAHLPSVAAVCSLAAIRKVGCEGLVPGSLLGPWLLFLQIWPSFLLHLQRRCMFLDVN